MLKGTILHEYFCFVNAEVYDTLLLILAYFYLWWIIFRQWYCYFSKESETYFTTSAFNPWENIGIELLNFYKQNLFSVLAKFT